MSTQKVTIEDVGNAAVRLYLRHGKDHDLTQIAGELGCSVATVRKRVQESKGFVPRCRWHQEARTSYSNSYRGFETGSHQVWVYGPSRETLRELLLAASPLSGAATPERQSEVLDGLS